MKPLLEGPHYFQLKYNGQKKKKTGRKLWRNPGAYCKHTEVSIRRDLSLKLGGELRGTTSSLGKSQLTLGNLKVDHPSHGFTIS